MDCGVEVEGCRRRKSGEKDQDVDESEMHFRLKLSSGDRAFYI
jgi:hypothetical protein